LIAATGTRVAITSAEGVKKVMPPLRTWLSMSVSPPSWLFGKILISTRPLVSLATRSAACWARMLSGWLSGRLLPYFSSISAARAIIGMPISDAAGAAARPLMSVRRLGPVMMSSLDG
jgi:hypothetical protein